MAIPNTDTDQNIDSQGPGTWTPAEPAWPCGTVMASNQTLGGGTKGYMCPADQGQYCTPELGDPNYGNTGFDNLGEAALLMIQAWQPKDKAFPPPSSPQN